MLFVLQTIGDFTNVLLCAADGIHSSFHLPALTFFKCTYMQIEILKLIKHCLNKSTGNVCFSKYALKRFKLLAFMQQYYLYSILNHFQHLSDCKFSQ